MLTSIRLPSIDGMPIYEFKTSYNRTIYVAHRSLESAQFFAERNSLFWDETIKDGSGKVATVGVYVDF